MKKNGKTRRLRTVLLAVGRQVQGGRVRLSKGADFTERKIGKHALVTDKLVLC